LAVCVVLIESESEIKVLVNLSSFGSFVFKEN